MQQASLSISRIKKLLAGFLGIVFFLTNIVSVEAFTDVKNSDWFFTYVNYGVKNGYINGSIQEFRPNEKLNRAEMAMFIVKAFKIPLYTPAKATFKDVPKNSWYFPYIETLVHENIAGGYTNDGKPTGNFGPSDFITREQVTKIIVNVKKFKITTDNVKTFPDVPKESWSFPFIMTLRKLNIMNGYPDGNFKPQNQVNRAEITKIIYQSLQLQ